MAIRVVMIVRLSNDSKKIRDKKDKKKLHKKISVHYDIASFCQTSIEEKSICHT